MHMPFSTQSRVLSFGAFLAFIFWANQISAAEVTDVADAADTITISGVEKSDPFDMYLNVSYDHKWSNGKITREPIVRPGLTANPCVNSVTGRDCLPVDELRWRRYTSAMNFGAEIGLFHDLALTVGFHYIFSDAMAIRYAAGVGPENSTVDPQDTTTLPQLFDVGTSYKNGFRAEHKGFGPMDLGLRFAPLSDERDETKPSWVLIFNWSNPYTSKTFDPAVRALPKKPGPVGDGVHRLTFGTAFSKRLANFDAIGFESDANRRGYIDPYMEFKYTLPIPQKSEALKPLTAPHKEFGRKPSQSVEANAGMEIVALEDLKNSRKVAVDLGLKTGFFSEGRNYSELTDALGELTYTEQYFHLGAVLGLNIQAAEFLRIKIGGSIGYNTEHFLTYEDAGVDGNDDKQVTNDPADTPNPYFCGKDPSDRCSTLGIDELASYDQVGFRFKDEEHVIVGFFATLMFTF